MAESGYTTIYIVRHGETDANKKGIIQGYGDSALNEEGEKQAKEVADTLKDVAFDVIFSSDLSRARQTAEIINLERKLTINTSHLLRERNWGEYEGKPKGPYREENKKLLEALEQENSSKLWKFKTKGMESDEELIGRFITILREIAVTYQGKTVLVVAHGGPMRTLLIHLGWGTHKELSSGTLKNAGYIKLESDGIEFIIKDLKGVEKKH